MSEKRGKRGYFISFEGGEGSGKSTQMRRLVAWLEKKQVPMVVTKEPGGTEIGERIREILLNPNNKHLSPRAELFLYQADRAQHAKELLFPALAEGKVVVTDRHADSSAVYQGLCRGLGLDWVQKLNRFATEGLRPDLVILLDLSEKVGIDRIKRRLKEDVWLTGIGKKVKLDRIDQEKAAFHKKVRSGFLRLARQEKKRFAVIDAARPEEEVWAEVETLVTDKLKRRGYAV